MASGRVIELYRHPVKGMRPERLNEARLRAGGSVEGDRAFAFQFLDESVPESLRAVPAAEAPWMSKVHLAVQHDWPDLARVVTQWNPAAHTLRLDVDGRSIEASVSDPAGRERLAEFVRGFLKTIEPYAKARHSEVSDLRLVGHPDRTSVYTDGSNGFVSLALQESLADLTARFGGPIDPRRFRLNLFLEGAPAWSELAWAGRELRVGGSRLRIVKAIGRCPNIDVDPDTGGEMREIFPRLKPVLGHSFMGVRATVLEAGEVRAGDRWELL